MWEIKFDGKNGIDSMEGDRGKRTVLKRGSQKKKKNGGEKEKKEEDRKTIKGVLNTTSQGCGKIKANWKKDGKILETEFQGK